MQPGPFGGSGAMRRAAAGLVSLLLLCGCSREEAEARLKRDLPLDSVDIITRDFHAVRRASIFSVTDFESPRKASSATAISVGAFQRDNGAGAFCPASLSRA